MENQINLQDFVEYLVSYVFFHRSEARKLAHCCVIGLIMDGERKLFGRTSERVHGSERGMQRLLTGVVLDEAEAMGVYWNIEK